MQFLNPENLEITHGIKETEHYQELLTSIRSNGILEPIKYVEQNGIRYIVDGHHRYKIAIFLGLPVVPVEQVFLPFSNYHTVEDLIYQDIR